MDSTKELARRKQQGDIRADLKQVPASWARYGVRPLSLVPKWVTLAHIKKCRVIEAQVQDLLGDGEQLSVAYDPSRLLGDDTETHGHSLGIDYHTFAGFDLRSNYREDMADWLEERAAELMAAGKRLRGEPRTADRERAFAVLRADTPVNYAATTAEAQRCTEAGEGDFTDRTEVRFPGGRRFLAVELDIDFDFLPADVRAVPEISENRQVWTEFIVGKQDFVDVDEAFNIADIENAATLKVLRDGHDGGFSWWIVVELGETDLPGLAEFDLTGKFGRIRQMAAVPVRVVRRAKGGAVQNENSGSYSWSQPRGDS
jgi:hypothetical protein